MGPVSVLLGDDHPLVIEGLRAVLAHHCTVVGVANDGRALVAAAAELRPDLVLLDIGLPLLNGIEAARQIKTVLPSGKIIFITQHKDRQYVHAAFHAGASAYVVKEAAATDLIAAIETVRSGKQYVSPAVARGIPEALLEGKTVSPDLFSSGLTDRQRQVLQLIAEGKTAKETAAILNISPKTVEYHKASIMEQLGLRTTAELTRYAIESGILPQSG
jgi:DNA-binding NarL/FixJ family response regulator